MVSPVKFKYREGWVPLGMHQAPHRIFVLFFSLHFFIVDLRVGVYSFLIIDSNFFTELHWASEYFLVNISAPLPHSWFIIIVYEFSCENMWSMLNLRKMKIKNETEKKTLPPKPISENKRMLFSFRFMVLYLITFHNSMSNLEILLPLAL